MGVKADNFHESPLGVFVDCCNEVTNQIVDGIDLVSLLDEYPGIVDDLLYYCNQLEGTPETQELYGRIRKFQDAWVVEDPDLIKKWIDVTNYICMVYPDRSRYVVRLDVGAKSMKARAMNLSQTQIRKVFDDLKLMVEGTPTGWVVPAIAQLKIPLLTPEVVKFLAEHKLVVYNPSRTMITTSGFLNPDFASLVASAGSVDDDLPGSDILRRAAEPPHRRAPK